MEVVVTGHNFESILLKDHPCHVCFKLAEWFQKRRLLNKFPIGSYVKTMSADGGHFEPRSGSLNTILEVDHLRTMLKLQYVRWRRPSWMEIRVTEHNFENWPLKDHPCYVCFTLAYWYQRRTFLNIFPIGSYVKTMSADGDHLGWRSGSLDIILKVDHLRTIHVMFALNWLTGFKGMFFKKFSHSVLC